MRRFVFVCMLMTAFIALFSFFSSQPPSPASEVKARYLQGCEVFIAELKLLNTAISTGDTKAMQQQFLKTRTAYKRIEVIVEYYFAFYAGAVNGPPIPYFEEDEADMPLQRPYGMQVIENLIFPAYNRSSSQELQTHMDELLRLAIELPTINESFEFNDANNFDAFVEHIYRITSMGIVGFDSQAAQNALPESGDALLGLKGYIALYKQDFESSLPGKYSLLEKYIDSAAGVFKTSKNFNGFNRMQMILNYLDPIAKILGEYKRVHELADNPSGRYYSAIKKNNSMFAADAFNVNSFIDDFTTTPEKIALGKLLFFEKGLSSNKQRSCASCHVPGKAFTDGLKTSMALDGHSALARNAPTIWNAALQRNLFVDSRSRNLEDQVMQVLSNALEMSGSARSVSEEIIAKPAYKDLNQKAYQTTSQENAAQNICNAIACYERTLIALNSRFDKHMNGQPSLTKKEINGFNLFMGKAKCGSCHFMPLFGGAKPPRFFYMESEVLGVPKTNEKKTVLDGDSGRYLATRYDIHLFAFKTPSLRNVALTAPYMHNGVFNTLEEVVDFYNNGGGKGLGIAPANQTLPFESLGLTKQEKADIIGFMHALTDTSAAY